MRLIITLLGATLAAILITSAVYILVNDPETQCRTAITKLTAFRMCEGDEKCFRTVKDYESLHFWTSRATIACKYD